MWRKLQQKSFIQASFWVAAAVVGAIAVLYAKLVSASYEIYSGFFKEHTYLTIAATPFLFVLATYLVVKFSPAAKGSGIPQVLEALSQSKASEETAANRELVSVKTAVVKVLSSVAGIFGGASIGREGPTVQISSSVFAWVYRKMKNRSFHVDQQSFLIAGAAAGVAAAFNTPLAGITFALEEITDGSFSQFKRPVMFSIIIAGITAQAIVGNYLYFGHPATAEPTLSLIPQALLIGILCGCLGGLFSSLLAKKNFNFTKKHWLIRSFIAGLVCAAIAYLSNGESSGSGYEVIKNFMNDNSSTIPHVFWVEKFTSTLFSYFSGMAGGIFAPSLSIGAGIGYSIAAALAFANIKSCVMMGMVAFFSGVVQAPLTAVIIVMEMTDEHNLIIPFMIAAIIAQVVGRLIMPVPVY